MQGKQANVILLKYIKNLASDFYIDKSCVSFVGCGVAVRDTFNTRKNKRNLDFFIFAKSYV